jgi:hypothetical protein
MTTTSSQAHPRKVTRQRRVVWLCSVILGGFSIERFGAIETDNAVSWWRAFAGSKF